MKSCPVSLFAATLAGLCLPLAAASGQTTLSYKFKAGDTLKYTVESDMQMTMNLMGNPVTTNMKQTSEVIWSIKSVDKTGKAEVAVKYGRQKTTIETPQGKTEVDSASPEAPKDAVGKQLYTLARKMSDLEASATFDATGAIADVKFDEKALKELQKDPGGLGAMISPETMRQTLGRGFLMLPKQAVEKGGTWKSQSTLKLPAGKFIVDTDYTYEGATSKDGRTLAKITIAPKTRIESKLTVSTPTVMKVKSQEGAGTALFDVGAGRLLESTIRQTLELELEVMDKTFSQRQVQTTTVRLVEEK